MTKEIGMRMTNERAKELGFSSTKSLVFAPVKIDLDSLSPAARWIAEHINATYVIDEARDHCSIVAESTVSMGERDRASGKSDEYVGSLARAYGDAYTTDPMTTPVTFPIFGRGFRSPELVIEETVRQLRNAGAGRIFVPASGEEFRL